MDKSKLKEITDSVFKRYPGVDRAFVTSDGQVFFDEAHAKNHAAPNKKRKELEMEKVLRGEKKEAAKTAKDLIAEIEAAGTAETVTALLEAEKAGHNRKSVIEAAIKRIDKLKAASA
ncbi:MAG: hypothetical protein LBL33_08805 [Tannerella sp.]|jgi:hypothetical protein|nr:hypothetical protein [Tannerella sp.]